MRFSHVLTVMCPGSSGVEQRTENPRVGSSNLPPGTIVILVSGINKPPDFNIGLLWCIIAEFWVGRRL